MKQLNLNVTADFAKDLDRYMRRKGISQKSEAIRQALREAVEFSGQSRTSTDFRNWRGLALKAPQNAKPRFASEDELWS